MTEAERVSAGLNRARKAMIRDLPADGSWCEMNALQRYRMMGKNSLSGFGKSGLIEGDYHCQQARFRLTPFGLELCTILKGQDDDAA